MLCFSMRNAIAKTLYRLECGLECQEMLTKMQVELAPIFTKEQPDYVLVYGDTNSTLAGARTANELNIPLVHVEAGLRSFNLEMPEEHNRLKQIAVLKISLYANKRSRSKSSK